MISQWPLPESDSFTINNKAKKKDITIVPSQDELQSAMLGGISFKKAPKLPATDSNKVKTKAKKKTYITGLHGSGSAKMKAQIRQKRANRHK